MNQHYLNRYYKFINSLKNQTVDGYFEKHHIVPRSHGGSNDKENLIKLTARQHYVAHWMLWKAYGKEMTTAFHYMTHVGRYGKRINSRTFELLKLEEDARNRSRKHTPEAIEKNRQAHLGKKITEEHKKAISKALKGKPKSRLPDVSIEKMKATRTTTTYSVFILDGNNTSIQQISTATGSGGGQSFTVSWTNGTGFVVTNTSGNTTTVWMSYMGTYIG